MFAKIFDLTITKQSSEKKLPLILIPFLKKISCFISSFEQSEKFARFKDVIARSELNNLI